MSAAGTIVAAQAVGDKFDRIDSAAARSGRFLLVSYPANVIELLIASPGDVGEERQIVRDLIAEWNVMHSRERSAVLLPLGWETHSAPDLSGRPQQIINDRLLVHADILVGIFWTRVGSPTGKAISGSVEEIAEHRAKGKPVMLYFSDAPVPPSEIEQDQYQRLKDFREWARTAGLVESYSSPQDFREKFRRQLSIALQDNQLLQPLLRESNDADGWPTRPARPATLRGDALNLLSAAAVHNDGSVMVHRNMSGTNVVAGRQRFGDPANQRIVAHWEAVVGELVDRGFLRDINGKGEIFHVTDAGYRASGVE